MRKIALITGGARGIGRGIAERLAREGWALALCGSRAEDDTHVQAAVGEIQALTPEPVAYFRCDVASDEDRSALVDRVYGEFGAVTLLVNNAGVGARVRADVLDMKPENYDWLMAINLRGPFFLTQAVARRMIQERQSGCTDALGIVNISSISATVASVSRGEYCISKAGVSMATRLWAVRLAEFDIPVYEVRPGIIRTDMTSAVVEKYDRLIAEGLVIQGRWGFPEDVGRAVAMLSRGDVAYSTGQVILVDGGMLLERL